ncbi:MAG TPA: radical SAM protein [Propylenella sp.]|nr:radical SAM protein [Propylenella sp.]
MQPALLADSVLPLEVEIEFTNHCNAHCTACPRADMPNSGMLRPDTLQHILAIVGDIRAETLRTAVETGAELPRITVAGGGEPFLHRDALSLLRQIRSTTPELHVITNGSAITPGRASELVALEPASITCSFWGICEAEYEAAMSLPFERTLARVEHLGRLCADAGIAFEISWVRTPEIRSTDEEIAAFWIRRDIPIGMSNSAMWNRAGLLDGKAAWKPAPGVRAPDSSRRIWCSEISLSVAFDWSGRCILCCCGYFDRRTTVLGNAADDDWATLRDRKRAILDERPLPAPCRSCLLPRRAQAEWLAAPVTSLLSGAERADLFYQ